MAVIGLVVVAGDHVVSRQLVIDWRDWLGLGFPLTSLPLRPSVGGGLALLPTWLADVVAVGTPVVVGRAVGARCADLGVGPRGRGSRTIVLSGTRSVLLIVAAVSIVALLIVVRARSTRRSATLAVAAVLTIGVVVVVAVLGCRAASTRADRRPTPARSPASPIAGDRVRPGDIRGRADARRGGRAGAPGLPGRPQHRPQHARRVRAGRPDRAAGNGGALRAGKPSSLGGALS